MKDSGVEWIGNIPADWDVFKGKYVLKYLQKPVKQEDDVITCFRDGEVTLRKNRREDGFTMSDKEIGYQGVDVGDLVVHGMDGFAGAIGISDSRGKASPVLNVLDSSMVKKFIMYYLRSMAYGNVFTAIATGIRVRSCDLRWNKLANLPYPVPPFEEQRQIADFLDQKCSEIDALTTDIQTQIETLEEYKKSVITEAVTKGLEPNVEMKDSGVEWIGMIPSSWKNKTLRHLLIDRVGGAWGNEPANENEGTVCLRIADFDFDKGLFKECALDELTYRTYTRKQIKKLALREGDILIEKSGGGEKTPVGRAVYYDGSYGAVLYANFMERLRFKSDEINSKFVEYWLRTWYFCRCSPFYINQTIGIQNIDLTLMLAKEQIFFPLLQDQYKIADFLDQKCSEIDQTISEKQQQLETLAEYKKSLIYEYVTGKKEVA